MCETLVTANFAKPTGCASAVGGMHDVVYVMNASEFGTLTSASTLGRISDITLAVSKTAFSIQVEKDSYYVKEEYDAATKTYKQTVHFKFANDTHTERNTLQSLVGSKIVTVGRTKNNAFVFAGVDYRGDTTTPANSTATPVGLVADTQLGSWAPDDFGNDLTMVCSGLPGKTPYLFDTDFATTQTLLEDLLP